MDNQFVDREKGKVLVFHLLFLLFLFLHKVVYGRRKKRYSCQTEEGRKIMKNTKNKKATNETGIQQT